MAPYEAGNGGFFSGNKGKFDRVAALWFEVRGLRVRWRAASRNASPGGRAPSLGAAERHLVFARACGSGGVEGPPQIQISHFEFDLVRAARCEREVKAAHAAADLSAELEQLEPDGRDGGMAN